MKCRMFSAFRLKPESVPEYVRLHQQVWPELLQVYREAGITQISCFLNGCDVVVYSEYEQEVYQQAKESLSHNSIELRWQALMQTLRDPYFQVLRFEEIFHMSALEGNL
ncbi:MAG: L-rhamnose mutarotase [Chloroflexi bacterium]|nr:MAG: L-rhamnose mutarotase [Chloroflexota bacterium]